MKRYNFDSELHILTSSKTKQLRTVYQLSYSIAIFFKYSRFSNSQVVCSYDHFQIIVLLIYRNKYWRLKWVLIRLHVLGQFLILYTGSTIMYIVINFKATRNSFFLTLKLIFIKNQIHPT